MSQENVELVLSLQPAPDADLARMFRDDVIWAEVATALSAVVAPRVAFVAHGIPDRDGEALEGVEALRAVWLEWLGPWETYRAEIERAVDLGDTVLLLIRDFGRRGTDTQEVGVTSAAVWTVQAGEVARVDFYLDRTEALKAVGLAE